MVGRDFCFLGTAVLDGSESSDLKQEFIEDLGLSESFLFG
jgi:hypothetical protein